jgi:hypothetical protein
MIDWTYSTAIEHAQYLIDLDENFFISAQSALMGW